MLATQAGPRRVSLVGSESLDSLLEGAINLPVQGANNLVFPWLSWSENESGELTEEEFLFFAMKSTKPRGKRKILRFPPLRAYYSKRRVIGDKVQPGNSYQKEIRRYLVRVGLRTLNDIHKANRPLPTKAQLEDLFSNLVFSKARTYFREDVKRPGLDLGQAERLVTSAVEGAIEEWDPAYVQRARARGMRGGRPTGSKKFTVEALQALDVGLTAQEQAKALGCSARTVKTLRARERAIDVASFTGASAITL